MLFTKYTHACVRLERDNRVLVIDPGVWSEPVALIDADAVLITHAHTDHIDVSRVAQLDIPVYAPAAAQLGDLDIIGLAPEDERDIAGFAVRAVGGRHAPIYGGRPDIANLGYIVDGHVYHPGDSVFVPDQPLDVLLVPMQGSWLKTIEAIDFVKAVRPTRAYGIHEGQLNERGLSSINGWLTEETGETYSYLAPGENRTLDGD